MNSVPYVFILSVCSLVWCKPNPTTTTTNCGYDSCHAVDPNKLNVHMVPHSHDDVGWLKTVDQYFYGSNDTYQTLGVQYILDTVMHALDENPDRRFIQVETAFFWKWWKGQTDSTRALVRRLVNSGRLEIIGGGWSMNDESATNYQSIIDQFTLGLKTINETLGECGRPKIGWQIDPFGHTREMASIFSQLGYDAVLFARLDYRDSQIRAETTNAELIWRGNPDLGEVSDLFTSLIYRFYDAPSTFCWDVVCGDAPIVDNKKSPEYNLDTRVADFEKYVLKQQKNYKTPNILITMGGDFTYSAASMYYKNIDKMIKGFNELKGDKYHMIYSTPSCYVKAVNDYARSHNLDFNLKTDDFIPYASDNHTYWTGYYTSRPNSKRFERQGNNLLQVAKQLIAFEKAKGVDHKDDIAELKEIMGVMQHHDAITGTEKQHVTNDYVRLLHKGVTKAENHIGPIIYDLLKKESSSLNAFALKSCLLSNVTHCAQSNKKRFVVAVYNPLSRRTSHYVRLPVTSTKYKVTGPDGSVLNNQIALSIDNFDYVQGIEPSAYELVFRANDLPPLGLKLYYVEKEDDLVNEPNLLQPKHNKFKLGNDIAGFEIDSSTGFLSSVMLNGETTRVHQEFLYYQSAKGDNKHPSNRASGAYIFRPSPDHPEAIPLSTNASVAVYCGELFDEVHQHFNDWTKQIIRVYKEENHIEFDWLVGPIEYINNLGVEVISRFKTDLKSSNTFYTDTNGRGLIKRVRNFRETFQYTNEEPVSGNYYPVTSRIVLKDENSRLELAVLNDRAQGGSSLKDGEVELMVHRRLTHDDDFGVGEVLNEQEFGKGVVVRGNHYLVLGKESSRAQQHDLKQRKLLAPWVFVGDATSQLHSLENMQNNIAFEFAGIRKSLPENIQLLTLEVWAENALLLRLEHVFEGDEDSQLSQPTTVDLKDILTLYQITSVSEMTLAANQRKDENKKLKWNIKSSMQGKETTREHVSDGDELTITLNPMEIRTFIVNVKKL